MKGLISAYKHGVKPNPVKVTWGLHDFKILPLEVKKELAEFYRTEFLYNERFINPSIYEKSARVNALIGLKYLLGLLNASEQELFERALSEGIIKNPAEGIFTGSRRLLP